MTPDQRETILERLRQGKHELLAAGAAGLQMREVRAVYETDPAFATAYEEASEAGYQALLEPLVHRARRGHKEIRAALEEMGIAWKRPVNITVIVGDTDKLSRKSPRKA